ncbi:MAG: integral membrane protein [Crocinitomicaceae bacterium]|jgi:integral membrane protein
MTLKTRLGQLRILATLEGISFLLLGGTMILKYVYEMGLPNKIVGMIHGILFIAYVIWVFIVGKEKQWGIRLSIICWLASLLPFAPFWVDARYLKPLERKQ